MYSEDQCDVCGRPAKYHETQLQAGRVVRKSLCGVHGRTPSLAAFKEVLAAQAAHMPPEWIAPSAAPSELQERIAEAASLEEIAGLLRIDRIADRFWQDHCGE